jgi:hypothetical protein
MDISISPDGKFALIADSNNHAIRRLDIATTHVSTLAGQYWGNSDGFGTAARFYSPQGVDISPDGGFALIADTGNCLLRKLDLVSLEVSTVAGRYCGGFFYDGLGTNAFFRSPLAVAISQRGGIALITDAHVVRRLDLLTLNVSVVAGGPPGFVDGRGSNASFQAELDVVISSNGSFALVVDVQNYAVRMLNLEDNQVTTLAGGSNYWHWYFPYYYSHFASFSAFDGLGTKASFCHQTRIALSANDEFALIADACYGALNGNAPFVGIRRLSLQTGMVTTMRVENTSELLVPMAIAIGARASTRHDADTCQPCAPGTFSNESMGSTGCTLCSAGEYASAAGSARCDACQVGTYGPGAGATACLPCGPGHFTFSAGARDSSACTALEWNLKRALDGLAAVERALAALQNASSCPLPPALQASAVSACAGRSPETMPDALCYLINFVGRMHARMESDKAP